MHLLVLEAVLLLQSVKQGAEDSGKPRGILLPPISLFRYVLLHSGTLLRAESSEILHRPIQKQGVPFILQGVQNVGQGNRGAEVEHLWVH